MTQPPQFAIGYARVSTEDQSLQIQLARLREAGCAAVYCEKVSGWGRDLPELRKAIDALPRGGVLIVRSIDRLGRSSIEINRNLIAIHDRGAHLRSMDEPFADTSTQFGPVFIAFCGLFAEMERKSILERTRAGRENAKRNGKKLGRRPKLSAVQKGEAVRRAFQGENFTTIGAVLGASRHTVRRFLQSDEAREQLAGLEQREGGTPRP